MDTKRVPKVAIVMESLDAVVVFNLRAAHLA
ncbi:hypothetical protein ABIC74_000173 [Mucilaginibacter rubeus]